LRTGTASFSAARPPVSPARASRQAVPRPSRGLKHGSSPFGRRSSPERPIGVWGCVNSVPLLGCEARP
jgi:hypothetical protein